MPSICLGGLAPDACAACAPLCGRMPPRGSGNGEKNAEAWQKAAVSYLIDTMGERGLVACVPKIAGNGRTHGDIDPKIGAELEAGLQEAVNAVRRSQQLDDCGVELLWKKVILPLERECGTGDPVAFRVAAERRGLGGYAAVRPTRANSAHVTSASAAENAAPQPPPPPPPPPDSPPRKPLSPLRVLATQSSAPSCSTALATPPRETRRGVSRMAQIEGVKMAVETSMGALAALHTEGLEELGAQLNAAQLAALLRGHVQAAGTATAVVPLLGTTARSQLVVAALRDPETTRRALQALLSVASDEGVAPPSTLPAMLQAALPQLDDSELLDMLDALAYTLMSKVPACPTEPTRPYACLASARRLSLPRPATPTLPPPRTQPPFKEGDAECLRKCVAAIRRVNEFRNVSGHGQSNFVRSILEAYGGDDGPRLPLGTVLTCVRRDGCSGGHLCGRGVSCGSWLRRVTASWAGDSSTQVVHVLRPPHRRRRALREELERPQVRRRRRLLRGGDARSEVPRWQSGDELHPRADVLRNGQIGRDRPRAVRHLGA